MIEKVGVDMVVMATISVDAFPIVREQGEGRSVSSGVGRRGFVVTINRGEM
jgi:hypothetical protein